MAPWEKYQAQPQASGPWAKYAQPVVQDGQQIGAYTQSDGPLRVMVDASPEPAPYDPLQRIGQSFGNALTGMGQGATMGAYDELASALGAPIKGIENLVTGQDQISGLGDVLPFLGRSFMDAREGQQAIVNNAYESTPIAAATGDIAGALGFGLLSGGSNVASLARPTMAGMATRGAVEGGLQGAASGFNAAEDPTLAGRVQAAGQGLAGGALIGGVTGGLVGANAARTQNQSVPSVSDLKQAAVDLYEAGRNNPNVFASPQESTNIASKIGSIARGSNIILPNGKLNSSYSDIAGILETVDAYAGQPVSVGEIQAIRDTIRDIASAPNRGQRIALDMLDEFNDYAYKVYPELAEADNLYWRAKTGELVERLGELATARSGQYTQSGMENALRAEFRALERQIIKGQVKGLPKELVEQISSISRGDDLQNAARWASRFSLKNPLTALGGTAAGFATGSFPVAAGVWGAAQGAGMLAEKLARDKYSVAAALARNGGPLAPVDYTPVSQALLNAGGNVGGRVLANF